MMSPSQLFDEHHTRAAAVSRVPQDGDVFVTRATARRERDVCIVSGHLAATVACLERAIEYARDIARVRRVDAWLTEDHTHFVQVGEFRDAMGPGSGRGTLPSPGVRNVERTDR